MNGIKCKATTIELDHIYNMDCLEGMKLIPDSSIDAVICDLPYGSTDCSWDQIIPFEPLWEQYRRICKPNAAIVLFGSEPFSSALRMSNLKAYKYDWVWYKHFAGNFGLAKIQPQKVHELISVFCFGKVSYNPQMQKRKKPIKKGGNSGKWGMYGQFIVNKEYKGKIYEEKFPESILDFNVRDDDRGLHPTQKPVDLLRYLVLTYTNPGG